MILLADDDADFADNCAMMLEAHGYQVTVVAGGAQALAAIADRRPDLLISDCCMPGMSGLQLSQEIRAMPAGQALPIVLISGSLQCRVAAGTACEAFLRKPLLAQDLLMQVRKLLHSRPVGVIGKK